MNFSSRTQWNLTENELARAVREARASGAVFDLTVSNPTACGFAYDADAILQSLSAPAALRYEPDPLGMMSAREAIALYYRDLGVKLDTGRLCLTTSTSEAYSFLFRLLCDPGDEVLVARPSYPLFDFIAQLDNVRLTEYALVYHDGWHIDLTALARAITPRTRAVIAVHPNNPTGNFVSPGEREALQRLCAEHGLALIVDEVFLDYGLDTHPPQTFAARNGQALTFVLSGLSKVCGLPQMKVSWIVASGPAALVDAAIARLEVIADTFLSVNAPMQQALPAWLAGRHALQLQVRERMRANLAALDERVRGTQADRLALGGGWTVVLRVPRSVGGRYFAEAAMAAGVVTQPGEFYGLPEGRIVLSLLTPRETWDCGLALLPID
jgi:alanine-synthesizing transaminase